MCSKRFSQRGVTLVEMIVTMVLFGIMAAVGSLLISKLAPSYLASVEAEQALSPHEAALWRLSEDFRRSLVDGTNQASFPNCNISMLTVSGLNGDQPNTEWVRYWPSGSQLWMSGTSVSGILLDNIVASGSCPIYYVSGVGTSSRAQLHVNFLFSTGGFESVVVPISMTLHSYVNGPYISAITPDNGSNTASTPVLLSGIFPGVPDIWTRIDFVSGGSVLFSKTPDTGTSAVLNTTTGIHITESGVVDVKVTTPEGWSILKNAFTFVSQ